VHKFSIQKTLRNSLSNNSVGFLIYQSSHNQMVKPNPSELLELAPKGFFREMGVQQMAACVFCSMRVDEYKDPQLHQVT
jgi:hypothetical protein